MSQATIQTVTYDLLRKLELKTIFGNPGSTEEPFLQNFPADFKYILGLHEASVVAMADGFAQASGKPSFVNLHTSAGVGNAMCSIMTAYLNKTPMIVTAGQQTREMIMTEPLLTNRDETMLPRPWVKWAYQPLRAQDVPAAIMRGYAMALQPPAGPVFISIPMDDWEKEADGPAIFKSVSTRFGPDKVRLKEFAEKINSSKKPLLVYGSEIDRCGAWHIAIEFAEKLNAPVYGAPFADRGVFPQIHSLFQGALPPAIKPLNEKLEGHDLVLVIGAPVFKYYPFVPGAYLPDGTELLQITNDSFDAASAAVGDSLLSDVRLALEDLVSLISAKVGAQINVKQQTSKESDKTASEKENSPLTAAEVFSSLSELRPDDAIVVQETLSNYADLLKQWPTIKPGSYYTFASGGLGWASPAAVGIALAEQKKDTPRHVVAFIGDGAFQYSVQSIYTAVQHKLKLIYVVPSNSQYAILKSFAKLEETPGLPGLDLPGLDIISAARGFGCRAVSAKTKAEVKQAFSEALRVEGPTVIVVPIDRTIHKLVS